jgi:HK97 family phage prohead protease
MNKREITFDGLHLREAADGKKSRTVVGHAVVFGQRSINLTPWSSYREMYEVIERGAITQELIDRSDVMLTAFHDNKMVLGRCTNGRGTLSLVLDERGLRAECTLAETSTADELLAAIERGDITGMSFAFRADEEDSENGVSYERTNDVEDGKEVWLRHVKRINGLFDVSIVTHPAYEQTSVATREQSEAIDKAIDAQLKRECGDKNDKRDDDPDDDHDDHNDPDDKGETDEEREAREKAEREANGGETNAEKEAREQREAEEEQKERERMATQHRLRQRAHFIRDIEIENFIV